MRFHLFCVTFYSSDVIKVEQRASGSGIAKTILLEIFRSLALWVGKNQQALFRKIENASILEWNKQCDARPVRRLKLLFSTFESQQRHTKSFWDYS